jgi:hypothetical protein
MRAAAAGSAEIERTVDALAAGVPRGLFTRRRPELLVEARDGLEDAVDAYRAAGLGESEAVSRALEDFGDVERLREDYAAQLVRDSVRSTSVLLGAGYLLVLGAWAVTGRLVPEQLPQGPPLAAQSFGWIGALAVAVTIVGGVSLRMRARRSDRSLSLAWLVGSVGLVCVVATWVASYLLQPWATRDHPQPSFVLVDGVEAFSALATLLIAVASLHCLRSAWVASRRPG